MCDHGTHRGESFFLLARRRQELIGAYLANQTDSFGLERYDGEEDNVERIIDALTVMPFLGGERMVVVRGVTHSAEAMLALEPLLDRIPENTQVIFIEPNPDRRTRFYKALKEKAAWESFEPLRPQTLHTWLVDFAVEQGFELTALGASELNRRIGNDQSMLAHEIQKLALLGKSTVDQDEIKQYVEPMLTDTIFDLLDSLLESDGPKVLQVYRELRLGKIETQEILGMIAWQIQLLVAAHLGASRSTYEVARETGFKPFSLERVSRLARRVRVVGLRRLLQLLSQTDTRLKSSRANKDALMELALVRSTQLIAIS